MIRIAGESIDATRYQTIWRRAAAFLVDGMVVYPLDILLAWALEKGSAPPQVLSAVLSVVLPGLYMVLLHGYNGQTFGKAMFGIQVLSLRDARLGYPRALLREAPWILWNALSMCWILPYVLGGGDYLLARYELPRIQLLDALLSAWFALDIAVLFFDAKERTLHDRIAGSVVVRTVTRFRYRRLEHA